MNLPKNGSVVVIDDQPNQAIPILKALSKKGIAATWYQGIKPDELPDIPVQNIRLAILDLQLIDGDNNGHTIATRLIQVLKRIIREDNGPYILLIWSLKDTLYAESLKKEINKTANNLVPSCIVTLRKVDCIKRVENVGYEDLIEEVLNDLGSAFEDSDLNNIRDSIIKNWRDSRDEEYEVVENAIETIEAAINEELVKAGVFNLLIIWENLIKDAGVLTVANISKIVKLDVYWEQNMRDVFRRMGYARVGQNEVSDEELLKASVLTFIQSFIDHTETLIKQILLPDYISLEGKEIMKRNESEGGDEDEYRLEKSENQMVAAFCNGEEIKIKKGTNILYKELCKMRDRSEGVEKKKIQILLSLIDDYHAIPHKLNTGLHLEISPTSDHIPGNIFIIPIDNIEKKKTYIKTYIKEDVDAKVLNEINFIELEVSPICDYAQKKWKKSRLISGIIYPENLSVGSNDNFYRVEPVFHLDGTNKRIVFDCHLFKSLDHEIVEARAIEYRLRRELLLDIIAKVSSHINRPGISFVP